MSYERNIKWLNDRRIVYRHDGSDTPTIETDKYKYYEEGTYACYSLFNTKAKITTYKSLKWHFLVLYYLNQDMHDDKNALPFFLLFKFIANKENGFVTFFISNKKLEEIIRDVLITGGDPPKNKLRKVIFKDYSMLTLNEKLSIVGKLIGRSSNVDAEAIYECMLDLNESNKKITWARVAGLLNCSVRTIYRNLDKHLKKEKQILNEEI
tara:strand:+ start:4875 stop:5501 length:627 start_codon:yes stop_codon:yes gene_type:complete